MIWRKRSASRFADVEPSETWRDRRLRVMCCNGVASVVACLSSAGELNREYNGS
jgi:hypothetical protein